MNFTKILFSFSIGILSLSAQQSHLNEALRYADPFYGNAGTDIPPAKGVAATWNWEKAQQGNTHPGPQMPFGMVSIVPYTGAYPTGYGANKKTFTGKAQYFDKYKDSAYGFTHMQQSGTGTIGIYYNFLRVSPTTNYNKETRKTRFKMNEKTAHPGYFNCTIAENDVKVELTAAQKVAYHRYHIPSNMTSPQISIDFSEGGLDTREDNVRDVKAQKESETLLTGEFNHIGFNYYFAVKSNAPFKNGSFYHVIGEKPERSKSNNKKSKIVIPNPDPDNTADKAEIKINKLTRKNCRMFYLDYVFDVEPGSNIELKIAFSFRSVDQAKANLTSAPKSFDEAKSQAESSWEKCLTRIPYKAKGERDKKLFYSNLYHSLVKPSICDNESPFWEDEVFVTDFSTLWDVYKTQIPLLVKYYPEYGSKVIKGMINGMDTHGYFPCGYQKCDPQNMKKFDGQCTGMEWVTLAYAYKYKDKLDGIDWKKALKNADKFAQMDRVQEILKNGHAEGLSNTHTLDVSSAFAAICFIAKGEGLQSLYDKYAEHRNIWGKVYDSETGLLKEGVYYEGTQWNYSFRPHFAMEERVKLAGGKEKFAELLDTFFGFKDIENGTVSPEGTEGFPRQLRKFRFEGLNNECDMETPYAYQWSSKPERTQEVIKAVMKYQFQPGPNGIPGNNDSGGTSSWWVLNAIEDFPLVENFED